MSPKTMNKILAVTVLLTAVAVLGCSGKGKESIKVGDTVFLQPFTVQYGYEFKGGSWWAEATVTAIQGDSMKIKPSPHWKDVNPVFPSVLDTVLTVSKDLLIKKIALKSNQVTVNMPVLARVAAWDTNYIYTANGTVAKIEGDSISVAYLSDQAPETTKVGVNHLWKNTKSK